MFVTGPDYLAANMGYGTQPDYLFIMCPPARLAYTHGRERDAYGLNGRAHARARTRILRIPRHAQGGHQANQEEQVEAAEEGGEEGGQLRPHGSQEEARGCSDLLAGFRLGPRLRCRGSQTQSLRRRRGPRRRM